MKNKLQCLVLFIFICILLCAEIYHYVYYVTDGSTKRALVFLALYHIIAFLYGHLFFGNMKDGLIFTIVVAALNLMGDYSLYAPSTLIFHEFYMTKAAGLTLGILVCIYVVIWSGIRIGGAKDE